MNELNLSVRVDGDRVTVSSPDWETTIESTGMKPAFNRWLVQWRKEVCCDVEAGNIEATPELMRLLGLPNQDAKDWCKCEVAGLEITV